MRNEIKSRLSILPTLLVLEAFVCFLFSYFDFYKEIFAHWEDLTECSFLMCIIFYAISDKWSFISKKSIITLFLLNLLNFIYGFLDTKIYYNIFLWILFSFFSILILYDLCRKK